jgi:hypothetical protein
MKPFIPVDKRCKAMVPDRSLRFAIHRIRCGRLATCDGYCYQHLPANVEKRRKRNEAAAEERYNNNPWQQLSREHDKARLLIAALKRIAETEGVTSARELAQNVLSQVRESI